MQSKNFTQVLKGPVCASFTEAAAGTIYAVPMICFVKSCADDAGDQPAVAAENSFGRITLKVQGSPMHRASISIIHQYPSITWLDTRNRQLSTTFRSA